MRTFDMALVAFALAVGSCTIGLVIGDRTTQRVLGIVGAVLLVVALVLTTKAGAL